MWFEKDVNVLFVEIFFLFKLFDLISFLESIHIDFK